MSHTPRLRRRNLAAAGAAVLAFCACITLTVGVSAEATPAPAASRHAHVPVATVSGPVVTQPHLDGTHGIPYTASAVDLATHGYTETEYFVSGKARAYAPVGTLTKDGKWDVSVAGTAAYKTRILVRKPIDMRTFSGTVVVEWMNATVGRDLDVGWVFGSNGMLHDNDIYVGVSAQALPITGAAQGLQTWDPERYGSLVHPGDQYSYDIFAQAAQALRHANGVQPLGGARIKSLLAYGDSQSAFRLVTYADALQNRDNVFDGILLNSRFGTGSDLNIGVTPPLGVTIRTDINAKVLTLETETDVLWPSIGFINAEQPDSNSFRDWEVAGASHFNAPEEATMRIQAFRESPFANPPIQFNSCPQYMNTLRFSDVVDTSIHDLARWTRDSDYKPQRVAHLATRTDSQGTTTYVKNALGLTLGGIQLPQVTVPTGVESGQGNTGIGTCVLAGRYVPFTAAQLTALYPTHSAYVNKFSKAVAASRKAGFIQFYDGDIAIAQAQNSAVPQTTYVP